jgi:hypothetical protein
MRGAAALELDPNVEEYFFRGRVFEEIEVRRLEARFGRENIVRQPTFDWGFAGDAPKGREDSWRGHADAFVIPEKTLVEIKSTTTPTFSVPMVDMAIAQLRIALRFYEHPEAGRPEQGWLELVDPNRLRPADVIVVKNLPEDELAIDTAIEGLRIAAAGGELPERVCLRPGQARSRLCPFGDACFEGWEPEPDRRISDPDVLDAVADLVHVRRRMAPLKNELKPLEAEEKIAAKIVAELVEEGETTVGTYAVSKTHVERAPSFQPKLARAAGFPMHTLDDFLKPGAVYDLVRVGEAEEPVDVDYGEEAPF